MMKHKHVHFWNSAYNNFMNLKIYLLYALAILAYTLVYQVYIIILYLFYWYITIKYLREKMYTFQKCHTNFLLFCIVDKNTFSRVYKPKCLAVKWRFAKPCNCDISILILNYYVLLTRTWYTRPFGALWLLVATL